MPLPAESVWDYPRPPRLEAVSHRLLVTALGHVVADSISGFRVLETSHPPTYYIPFSDVASQYLIASERSSYCEFKGRAKYFSIAISGTVLDDAAWFYPDPTAYYNDIAGFLSFYASPDLHCQVGDEKVIPQDGKFYGGWITPNMTGPFKGRPGTLHW